MRGQVTTSIAGVPFVLTIALFLLVLILFPPITTWLPSQLGP